MRYKLLTASFVLMAVVYIIEAFAAPVPAATLHKYHISVTQVHELLAAITLPYLAIWGVALVGYLRLRSYTESLGTSKDGRAFRLITKGVFWFTVWLPLSALLSAWGDYAIRNHTGSTAAIIRMEVYANILLLIPAFVYVFEGSKKLVRVAKSRLVQLPEWLTLSYIAFAALYTYLTLTDSARRVAPDATTYASYYLPDWLIITTVIIPRLILWFLGIQAVYNIVTYRQKVGGIIYRRAL
jgi:hypothetical protein